MKYFKEAKELWNNLVPKNGQATSVQGELIRAIEKLRDEAQRNGNINWDEGHVILSDFILKYLEEDKAFSEVERSRIKELVSRIKKFDNPYVKDDIYDELTDYVVEWTKRQSGLLPNSHNPSLHR